MLKRLALPLVVFMLLFSFMPASATDAPPPTRINSGGKVFNISPVRGSNVTGAVETGGGGKLTYHGGKIMVTNKIYVIYWVPAGYSVASGYSSIINGYFKNVAAASGATSNVYYSSIQYYSGTSPKTYITYKSTFAGSYVDKNPYPANGCALYNGLSNCLTDAQIASQVAKVVKAKGWKPNINTLFFILTADKVGSCFDSAGTSCAYTAYCGYHTSQSANTNFLYSNMPYTGTNLSACGVPYSPNNNFAADSEISVISHEHMETITDPNLNAWYDSVGNENGDKCAWNFGPVSASHKYNQTINGHKYILQKEWSNFSSGCVLTGK